jgi:elongation factor P hydroxylase
MPFTEQVSAQVQQLLDPKVAERNQFAAPCLTAQIQAEELKAER